MAALAATLAEQARALSLAELVAVATAVGYLLLAIRQNIWCWACAAVSTSIYVALFIEARLYMESALNVFYLGMAGYGWFCWHRGAGERPLPVTVWPVRRHAIAVTGLVAIAVLNGYLLSSYTDAMYPYVDSATTWGAIWATYLVAQKVLENWWYWLAIDSVSVVIYWLRDLELTALLFVAYVCMIPFGFLSWRRSMSANRA